MLKLPIAAEATTRWHFNELAARYCEAFNERRWDDCVKMYTEGAWWIDGGHTPVQGRAGERGTWEGESEGRGGESRGEGMAGQEY